MNIINEYSATVGGLKIIFSSLSHHVYGDLLWQPTLGN